MNFVISFVAKSLLSVSQTFVVVDIELLQKRSKTEKELKTALKHSSMR